MRSRERAFYQRAAFIIPIAVFLFILLLSSGTLLHLLTESWWFDAAGFSSVFWTIKLWQIAIWIATFAIFALFMGLNYYIAARVTRYSTYRLLESNKFAIYAQSVPQYVVPVVIFFISLAAAGSSLGSWEAILKFINASNFGDSDPIFKRDLGFYIFQLPFFDNLFGWLLGLVVCGLLVSVPIYILKGNINLERGWQRFITGGAKTHITLLLTAIAVLVGIGFWLQRYDLLYSQTGVVAGAGYTDTHARLMGLSVMSIIGIALAVLLLLSLRQISFKLPVYGLGVYVLGTILLTTAYPSFQQNFIVEPNELQKEKPYIDHNISLTRKGYNLDKVQRQSYPAEGDLNRQDLDKNQTTVRNIRLWDYRPLLTSYGQLQEIRPYYNFRDIDVDRYTINGEYRQVMLSARELSNAPRNSWVSERLKYTHGYGLVMSPVNLVTPQGLPELFIKDIPPVSNIDLEVERSGIYYGQETNNYVFTGTSTEEFDYPLGERNAKTMYSGEGGVPMESFLKRLAYATDLGSLKILISPYFTDNSRIHYHRNIEERVARVAPFLQLDSDPYIALIDGELKWVIEGYTVSDRFPYSQPISAINGAGSLLGRGRSQKLLSGGFNYVRNSVKVVVDAYDGTMNFYTMDENDPILATYRNIFPDLFQPKDAIPPEVQKHFRYPFDLFNIQAQMYLSYHMSDPEVFYNQEDLWRLPNENFQGRQRPVSPYYVIMRLPEEEKEEFLLILPFTPTQRDNMIAWMAARSDREDYGKLLLYEFPKQELIFGPSQIEARINQNPEISEQLSLWDQQGSRVIRGNLLVIPIEQSLIYIEPIYLRSEQGELPELKRVIASYDNQVVMRSDLETSLEAIFGEQEATPAARPIPSEEGAQPLPQNLIQKAQQTFDQAQQAAREGNWAEYGRQTAELEQILQQLDEK